MSAIAQSQPHSKKERKDHLRRGPKKRVLATDRDSVTRTKYRKYNESVRNVRIPTTVYTKLVSFAEQHQCPTMGSALEECMRLHGIHRGSISDAKRLKESAKGVVKTTPAERNETIECGLQPVKAWPIEAKVIARNLQSACRLSAAQMPMVCAETQMLWTGHIDPTSIPTPHDFAEWATFFDVADRNIFAAEAADISVLHLCTDGSKKEQNRWPCAPTPSARQPLV